MPYLSTDSVKQRRNAIKKQFPQYKFSIRGEHYSSINVSIMSGPIELTDKEDGHEQLNHFQIQKHFEDNIEARNFVQAVYDIASSGNKIESVDGDYGNIPSFYIHLEIGKWDKPYVVKQ